MNEHVLNDYIEKNGPLVPLDPEVKTRWLRALRTQEVNGYSFGQTHGALRRIEWSTLYEGDPEHDNPVPVVEDDSYCCLGVLCMVEQGSLDPRDVLSDWLRPDYGESGEYEDGVGQYGAGDTDLPWLSTDHADRDEQIDMLGQYLSDKNDSGASFAEIADWIDANL